MTKTQKRTIGAIAILVMLGVSPMSITYSFAGSEDIQDAKLGEKSPETTKTNEKEGQGMILTEKLVDGKLEVRHYALPDNISERDMLRTLSVGGDNISAWAYVNYKSYHSGIVLFDGIASKAGDNLWEISSDDGRDSEEAKFYQKSANETGENGPTKEDTWEKDVLYRVIFSGKTAENDLAIFFMKYGIKSPK